jgi:hypothetical protein
MFDSRWRTPSIFGFIATTIRFMLDDKPSRKRSQEHENSFWLGGLEAQLVQFGDSSRRKAHKNHAPPTANLSLLCRSHHMNLAGPRATRAYKSIQVCPERSVLRYTICFAFGLLRQTKDARTHDSWPSYFLVSFLFTTVIWFVFS